uniref:Peptidase M43 pregnancy-associated plasma-A domain-containing protein n=1 Tax=viral metagenome TaxID=1070528 RepID=A0A6C0LQF0_9ZZZZ
MSRINNRIIKSNKINDQILFRSNIRKCAFHSHSYLYANNLKIHDEIMERAAIEIANVDMFTTINIKIIFHFMGRKGTYMRERVVTRVHDIILSINDDFNNYSTNSNTMNNFKYKSIINQVFLTNNTKQQIYLDANFTQSLPLQPSNIVFELGQIYYYPINSILNLVQYDDVTQTEMEFQAIKNFIHENKADAINPENFLNIWIIDVTEISILGFSNFPWETLDNNNGIVMSRRAFFPEEYQENIFNLYKTFTHEIGHYLGLLHIFGLDVRTERCIMRNMHFDNVVVDDEISVKINLIHDPTDKLIHHKLHEEINFNPLFMNFMDYTQDRYVSIFTIEQIREMRYMILVYRRELNSLNHTFALPTSKYNPETDTLVGVINQNPNNCQTLTPNQIENFIAIQEAKYPINYPQISHDQTIIQAETQYQMIHPPIYPHRNECEAHYPATVQHQTGVASMYPPATVQHQTGVASMYPPTQQHTIVASMYPPATVQQQATVASMYPPATVQHQTGVASMYPPATVQQQATVASMYPPATVQHQTGIASMYPPATIQHLPINQSNLDNMTENRRFYSKYKEAVPTSRINSLNKPLPPNNLREATSINRPILNPIIRSQVMRDAVNIAARRPINQEAVEMKVTELNKENSANISTEFSIHQNSDIKIPKKRFTRTKPTNFT